MKSAVIIVSAILLIQSLAFAHEGEKHSKSHKEDTHMGNLHKMMPMYAQAQAKITAAMEKKDAATAEKEIGKILATMPDLKNAKPHKNLKALKAMRKIASAFEEDIRSTSALIEKRDFSGASVAFENAQRRCNECHVKFRDQR